MIKRSAKRVLGVFSRRYRSPWRAGLIEVLDSISAAAEALLYRPYLADLRRAAAMLDGLGLQLRPQLARSLLEQRLRMLARKLRGAARFSLNSPVPRLARLG